MPATLSPTLPDDTLARCRRGDADAVTDVYRRFARALYGTALRLLRRPEEAEDVVQEAFLALCDKTPEIPVEGLGSWLSRVVVNRSLDRLRRAARWRTEEVPDELRPASPTPVSDRLDLERAVSRLPEKARVVFLLHDVEGLTHREIGLQLDLNEGTTKSQLFRARRILRRHLERPSGEPS